MHGAGGPFGSPSRALPALHHPQGKSSLFLADHSLMHWLLLMAGLVAELALLCTRHWIVGLDQTFSGQESMIRHENM